MVLLMSKIRTDRRMQEIGHRRARMQLYGAPEPVMEALERFDTALAELADTQMARGDVNAAGKVARDALENFTAAATADLDAVWPLHDRPGAGGSDHAVLRNEVIRGGSGRS
jgi:hypothetical protein